MLTRKLPCHLKVSTLLSPKYCIVIRGSQAASALADEVADIAADPATCLQWRPLAPFNRLGKAAAKATSCQPRNTYPAARKKKSENFLAIVAKQSPVAPSTQL